MDVDHFWANCPNRRVLTIREIEGMDKTEVEGDQEKSKKARFPTFT